MLASRVHRPRIAAIRVFTLLRTFATEAPTASTSSSATPAEASKEWTPQSRRVGIIARKRGMMSIFDDMGVKVPVTVLQLEDCQVMKNVETPRANGTTYHAIQVGASNIEPRKTTAQMLGHFKKCGVPPKRFVKEFPVSEDAHVPVGTKLSALHFVPGQLVDVTATSVGKGFQGVMKRWNFGGLAASHGVSISHRSAGSTGQHQDPGRVWPGKKMAGRMGGKQRTLLNLAVVRIDTALNVVMVKGNVPGNDDAVVYIRDAVKKLTAEAQRKELRGDEVVLPRGVDKLPFPAGTEELAQKYPPIIVAPPRRVTSPFIPRDSS